MRILRLGARRSRRSAAGIGRVIAVVVALVLLVDTTATRTSYGPFGPPGARMGEQLWLLPSGSPGTQQRATVFFPSPDAPLPAHARGDARRRPMVLINHGTSEWTRLAVSMPVYYWMSRWFVERGYVVVLPQRRGHGATGGDLVEAVGGCVNPDHAASGERAADDIEAALNYMARQPFIDPAETIVVGISTGGWGSLALAARGSPHVRAVINVAGGRGGHAWGVAHSVCAPERLTAASGQFGATAQVPTLWLYADNDTYFGPELATAMHAAWTSAGGKADLRILPAYGREGHAIADDQAGWDVWGPAVAGFLAGLAPTGRAAPPRQAGFAAALSRLVTFARAP